GDAFAVHVAGAYPGVERQRREDRRLRRGVEALDVGGRVGFGVPERGRLLQRLGEPGAGGVHRGQDVVGGAVDDAGDPDDPVAVQRLAQRPQQRDGTRDGGLEVQVGVAVRGRVVQGTAVLGEQRLVRGDDALAGTEGLDQPGPGRLDAADDLDDHVDVVPLD